MFPPREVREALERGGKVSVSGLTPSAAAYLAASLPEPGRLMVVAAGEDAARAFASDLSFFLAPDTVSLLPPAESVPLERSLPDPDLAAQRILALARLSAGRGPVIIPAAALLQPVPPPGALAESLLTLRRGQTLDRDRTVESLLAMGYRRVGAATETGEMAVRGGILDIFPPGRGAPLRIELEGEEVLSLRSFDPDSQRSTGTLDQADVFPVSEVPRDSRDAPRGRDLLVRFLASRGLPLREQDRILFQWESEGAFPGLAAFLPLLHRKRSHPLDHLPPAAILLLLEPEEISSALHRFHGIAPSRAVPELPDPGEVYARPEEVLGVLSSRSFLSLRAFGREGDLALDCRSPLPLTLPTSRPDRVAELAELLRRGEGRVVAAARSASAAERLEALLSDLGIALPRLPRDVALAPGASSCLTVGALSAGFSLPGEGLVLVCDSDLFGPAREVPRRRGGTPEWDLPIGSLSPGDVVVHIDHGIARYQGLRQLTLAGQRGDFLHLLFEGGDSLYVPVEEMRLVAPYRSAAREAPPLSRLGGVSWRNTKARVRRSLRIMAGELLRVSAERNSRPGFTFPHPDHLFREFAATFPWTETPDQEKAMSDVLADMATPRPMDRLVCGDVGFGKTEVALRAAFLAVEGGKQAAVLVPTTVLAQQHYQTFRERLGPFPVQVAVLSRFVSPQEQKKVVAALAGGGIDVVIGTHRLLSSDVAFRDLGLLVVDEEHRFGVRHKEKLKKLKASVDVLTLSATPIPRTLFSALSGLRDLSLINTPPAERKAVHTEIRYFEQDLIRDAVLREMDRGGQVFIVHNWVRGIEAFQKLVSSLVPHARVGVAHGQMEEKDLEDVMVRFLRREFDILVSTSIIESGLDIPNANTLIVNRADRYGLAQLYQIRGRVGRSPAHAYAYLLVPPEGSITHQAKRRLLALREMTELGSGFRVASYDLELRGAGNLLGAEQSGHVTAVGLDLYTQLLEQAIRDITGQALEPAVEPKLHLPLPAFLPETYLAEVGERLTLYKRLASAGSEAELEAMREEVADRFGRLPEEVQGLFTRMRVLLLARALGVERVDTAGPLMLVAFHPRARIAPDALVALLTGDRRLRFLPPVTLRLDTSSLAEKDRAAYLMETLRSLAQSASGDGS